LGADPLRKVRPGDEIIEHLKAESWNAFVDTVNDVRLKRNATSGILASRFPRSDLVYVRNDSGGARARYDILCLDGVVFSPSDNQSAFLEQPVFKGVTPTLAKAGLFAMLLEPAGSSGSSRYAVAAVSGNWVANVDIDHEDHRYADVVASSYRLTSNWYGGAEIIYKPTGTGDKYCIVRLGSFFAGPIDCVISETGGITAGSSGDVDIWIDGAVSSPLSTVTAYHNWMDGGNDATEDAEARIFWSRDLARYQIQELEC